MRGVKAMLGLKDEEDHEEYEEEQVGSGLTVPQLVFDDEIVEVLEADVSIADTIPRPFITTDGTRIYLTGSSEPEEVELEVVNHD